MSSDDPVSLVGKALFSDGADLSAAADLIDDTRRRHTRVYRTYLVYHVKGTTHPAYIAAQDSGHARAVYRERYKIPRTHTIDVYWDGAIKRLNAPKPRARWHAPENPIDIEESADDGRWLCPAHGWQPGSDSHGECEHCRVARVAASVDRHGQPCTYAPQQWMPGASVSDLDAMARSQADGSWRTDSFGYRDGSVYTGCPLDFRDLSPGTIPKSPVDHAYTTDTPTTRGRRDWAAEHTRRTRHIDKP